MADHLKFLKDEVDSLKQQGLFGQLPVMSSQQANRVVMNGKEVVTLSSNNYLGFANHPNLVRVAKAAMDK